MMFGDERGQNLLAQIGQTAKRSGFVETHQSSVTNHVSGKNGSKSAFQMFSPPAGRL